MLVRDASVASACLLAVCALVVLPSCETAPTPVAPTSATALSPVTSAAAAAQQAAAASAAAQSERDSKLAASSEVIERQNAAAPASPQKPVIAAEVGLLRRILDRTATDADRAAALERESLLLSGKLSEAAKHYAAAEAKADALNAQIAAANARADEARQQLASAIAKASADLAAQQAKHTADMAALKAAYQAKIDGLNDSIAQRVRFWTSLVLYAGATLCLLLAFLRIKAAMATGLDILTAVKTAATWTGLAAALFSLSRILSAWWFWYACAGVVALVLAYVAYLVWREQKGEAAKRTLAPVVKVLDRIYDTQVGKAKDDMDATIFAPLSEEMKAIPGAKAFIHETRATMPTVAP